MRPNNQGPIEELFAFYALGTLTKDERDQVEAYLERNPEAREQLQEMIEAASALAYASEPIKLRDQMLEGLLSRIRPWPLEPQPAWSEPFAERRFATWFGRNRANAALALLSLLIAAISGVWVVQRNVQVTELRAELADLQRTIGEQNEIIAQIAAPAIRIVEVLGTTDGSSARGRLYADLSTTTAVLVVWGLNPLPPDQSYQVWLIADENPVSAGLLTIEAEAPSVHLIEASDALRLFQAIGISVEPIWGSEQPTGAVVMFGRLAE